MQQIKSYLKWIPYIIIVALLLWTNLISFSNNNGTASIDFNYIELTESAKGIIKSQDGDIID